MPRKKTVKLNIGFVTKRIKEVFRHNVAFAEKMGRASHPTWVSDWLRTPPKGLPSPEEAARMCVLLQTTPEEILVEQADIDLVNGLLEQEREKSTKKEPAENSKLSYAQLELIELSNKMSDDELRKFIAAMKAMIGD